MRSRLSWPPRPSAGPRHERAGSSRGTPRRGRRACDREVDLPRGRAQHARGRGTERGPSAGGGRRHPRTGRPSTRRSRLSSVSAMRIAPFALSTAAARERRAAPSTAGPPSPAYPHQPVPATVAMVPSAATLRTRPFRLSPIRNPPSEVVDTPTGCVQPAAVAAPPSPENPAVPVPASAGDHAGRPRRAGRGGPRTRPRGSRHPAAPPPRPAHSAAPHGGPAVARSARGPVARDPRDRPAGGHPSDAVARWHLRRGTRRRR